MKLGENNHLMSLFCFVLTDGQEKQFEVVSLTRERPIGWDIAHVQEHFTDLLPSNTAQVHC